MGEQKLEERLSFSEQYRVLESLGDGAQGEVFKVEKISLGTYDAAKIIGLKGKDAWEKLQRLQDATRALKALSHETIIAYKGDYEAKDTYGRPEFILVMEYVDGKSLADCLEEGRQFREEELEKIREQLIAGLSHAHERGIVHRDMKPKNILLRDDGTIKIGDFGIAKFLQEETRDSSVGKGTLCYEAPEQLFGGKITEATDYYGLGLTLLALASVKERTDDIRFQKPLDDIARLRKTGRYSAPFLDSLELLVDENPARRKEGLRIKEDIGEAVGGGEREEGRKDYKRFGRLDIYYCSLLSSSMGWVFGIVSVSDLASYGAHSALVTYGTACLGGPLLMFTYRNAFRPLGIKVGKGIKRLFSREKTKTTDFEPHPEPIHPSLEKSESAPPERERSPARVNWEFAGEIFGEENVKHHPNKKSLEYIREERRTVQQIPEYIMTRSTGPK